MESLINMIITVVHIYFILGGNVLSKIARRVYLTPFLQSKSSEYTSTPTFPSQLVRLMIPSDYSSCFPISQLIIIIIIIIITRLVTRHANRSEAMNRRRVWSSLVVTQKITSHRLLILYVCVLSVVYYSCFVWYLL